MDQFIAYLLIKQIERDTLAQQYKNDKNDKDRINNCPRCGQHSYWCQC